MLAHDIQYSFPNGPAYQDEDGNKVLIICKPEDNNTKKFVGIVNGDLFPFDAEDLAPWSDEAALSVKPSALRKALSTRGVQPEVIAEIIDALTPT